jgi:hypothetical protein
MSKIKQKLKRKNKLPKVIPSKLTPEETVVALKKAILEYLEAAAGATFTAAYRSAGVKRTLFYNWLRHDPEFRKAAEAAREDSHEEGGDLAESAIMQMIREKNLTATIFYLKTKHKKRGYVEQHQLSNDPEHPFGVAELGKEGAIAEILDIFREFGIGQTPDGSEEV